MNKVSLCPLTNKVLVYEETDTISQSIFNSKKRLFDSSKKAEIQTRPKHIQNVTNKIIPIHNIININNNKILPIQKINMNINDIYTNKNNIKKINVNNNNKINIFFYIKNFIKYSMIKYNKFFERNCDIFLTNCIINKYISVYNINDDKYIKQYYCYDDSLKIIPKKEVYYKHHMLYLETPNFKNAYVNRIKKNYCLEKLYLYLIKRKKEKTPEQLNNSKNNLKDQDENKIFNTSILETIENYSTTITQGSNNEKYPLLTPFEIFKRCEDTNKKKNDTQKKDQKSIITFSESEISCKSKNIIDNSLIAVVKDLSEKPNKFRQYKQKNIYSNNIHNLNNSKSLTNKKQITNMKDIKKGINTIFSLNQNFIEMNMQDKKYTNFFIKKKDIEKFTKGNKNTNNNINIKNNRNNNEEKEVINKRRVSTSTNRKNKKILFEEIYQNTILKCNSKKGSFINNIYNITSNKNEGNKTTTNYQSFGLRRKNKGVLNLKKESYKIRSHITKFSDNHIISDNSHSNSNITNTNSNLVSTSYNGNIDKLSILFNPKDKNQYDNISKSKYAEFSYNNAKRRQIKKNTTFTMVNNIINIQENSQEKYKNKKDTNFKSKSPLSLIVTKKNANESNNKRKRTYKKKKTVLIPTSFQYMKLNKLPKKSNLLK